MSIAEPLIVIAASKTLIAEMLMVFAPTEMLTAEMLMVFAPIEMLIAEPSIVIALTEMSIAENEKSITFGGHALSHGGKKGSVIHHPRCCSLPSSLWLHR